MHSLLVVELWPALQRSGDRRDDCGLVDLFLLATNSIMFIEKKAIMLTFLWRDESGQDVAEYAVMLAPILVVVYGTVHMIGGRANDVFSKTVSAVAGQ